MHLPLLLVQDTILKTKTPWPNLNWVGEDGRRVCSISQHLVREVDLSSGSCSKVAKLMPLTKTAAAINTTSDGVFVHGILSSGDLFFWHSVTNQVWQAKGIPEVVTHTTNPPESHVVRNFFKQLLPQGFGSNVTSDDANQASCSVPSHHTPKIFTSSTCSKVLVVLGASQVYVWERSMGSRMEDCPLSQHVPGSWSVAVCPGDVPLPSTHSKETQISCRFMYEESSEECHITFTFVECSSVVVSTLALKWQGSGFHPPVAHWNSQLVSFPALGVRENELLHTKGTLISSYAYGRSLLAVAVNSQKQHSKLLYIHPLCNTAVITNIQDAASHLRSSNRNTMRSQWVSDLAWSHDSLYLFGCLMSGALFIATRMGPLVKISCQGEGIQLQAANILGLHPYSVMPNEEVCEEEGNKSPREPPSVTFCVTSHPSKHQALLSSGLRVSVLSLPLDGRKEGEVVDCLLASATHALHLLCNSAVTHDYAYIRDSTWRLAHSVLDLTQGFTNASSSNPPKINLWDTRVTAAAADKAGSQERTPGDDGELMQIEQVMKPLMAAWTLTGSRSGPHTMEWRRRAGDVVLLVMKLVATLLRITTHDDHFEHQLQLLLVLHFYHQFVRVLCVWPNSFHMMKPTLQLTLRLLHTVLACEKHAGERSMMNTLLILTQTLSSVEHSLIQAFALRLPLHLQAPSKDETVQVFAGVDVTNCAMLSSTDDKKDSHEIDNTVSLRMKKVWQCLHENAKKVYTRLGEKKFDQESYQKSVLVLNILQSKLQNIGCDLSQRMVKLGKCHQLYLDGLYLKAIQAWKCEIITCITKGHGKKLVAQDLHSILYACFVHEGFLGVSDFINWLYTLLRSLFSPKKLSSPPNKSDTKAKSDEIWPSFEYSKLPKIGRMDEAATKEESQKTEVPVVRKLFHKEISSEIKVHKFSPVERASSQEYNVEVRTASWLIRVTRQVIGSLGRILALETLGCHPDVPAPHKPHAIPPLWTSTMQPQGKVHQLSTMREKPAVTGQWSVDAAAQALALAGCWGDLAVFASWLGDAKMALVAGVLASIRDNKVQVPNTVLPLHQIKDLLRQPTTSTSVEFHCHQELLHFAAMANLEVLPGILEECLAKMKELTPLFETFVPSQVHLPAPPVFCPLGPQDGEELPVHVPADSSQSERRLRQEVAGWLRLACQVTSAAGIAYPLLLSLQQEYSKLPLMGAEDLSSLVESLGCLQEHWHPHGPEWETITQLWHKMITLVWVLYSRDKLSLGIRSLVRNASALRQNQELQETFIFEILSWVGELNTLCEHDFWKTDLVACAVTAASEAPAVTGVAAALAKIIPRPSEMSSLLRDKAERLFVIWKSTNIAVSEVKPCLKGKQNKREDISSPEIFISLFSFYEDRCEEITNHLLSEKKKKESSSFMNKYPTKSSCGTSVAARIQEEFGKFLILFVELTFMRDVQKFPQQTSPVPLLVQFSDVLRRREFEGMKLKNRLHHDTASNSNSLKHNILNSPCVGTVTPRSTVTTPEKKGLFRSLDYAKMLPRGSQTIFISPGKRHVANTPRGTPVNKALNHFEKQNSAKSKMSSPSRRKVPTLHFQGRKSRSLSRQKKRSVSIPRPRSLSVSDGRQTALQRLSKQCVEPLGWKTSQSSSNVIKNLPIQKLLYLPQCLGYNTERLEAEDTLKLLYWMMNRERRLCLPVVESNSYSSGRLTRKLGFTVDDVILSLMWNHLLKSWSHMKNEKRCPEMTNTKLRKKKKKEARVQRRTESVDVTHNELVASDDGNVQVEVHQDTVISPIACPAMDLGINSISASSKDKEYIPEEANGDEKDEQLNIEPDAESMNNSYLTKRDQDREVENKENVKVDGETECPLHLPCDLPDTEPKSSSIILSDLINIENLNKGTIINSSEGGEKQGIGSGSKESSVVTPTQCEDQDPYKDNSSASMVTNPSKTFKEKTLETSPVSSRIVELQQEDINPGVRAKGNNKEVLNRPNSRSESSSSDVWPPFNINLKKHPKGHQVKVYAKEAKQSVPSRLPILPARQKVSNMTGVEAPEESSDPGIVPFGHLIHLPLETLSASKMLRLPDIQSERNKLDPLAVEDTLDNITLPDSLHASDLEEQSELSAPSQNIEDNIRKRRNYEPADEKLNDRGTGLSVPLCVKKRGAHGDHCLWDHGNLKLKRVAVKVKSASRTIPRDEMSTSANKKSMAHIKEKSNVKKSLKLLTLPNISSAEKCDAKPEKPLLLKQIPVSNVYRDIAKEDQKRNKNVIASLQLHSKKEKVEDIRPLTIPKYFDSYPKSDGKTKALNFLHPHQVFAFYRQSALKKHAQKFNVLKVSKKYIVPDVQPDTKSIVNIERKEEQKRSDQLEGNLDKGFLDQVKEYADKYKKRDYENILRRGDTEVSEKEIRGHYKPINNKKTVDKSTQNDLHLTGKSKPVENNQSYIGTKDEIGTEKAHSGVLKDNLMKEEKELASKSVNTEPYEMRQKIMKATGTQASNMETGVLHGNRPSGLPSISAVQTQTPTPQMVEASVLTDTIVSSKSESVHIDSLLPPPASPPPGSPSQPFEEKQAFPTLQSADLPPQPSPSYTAPIHHSQTPSDTASAQGFVHIFDIPSEVVREELKDIEMNKTIHSLDAEKGDQYTIQSLFNLNEKTKAEKCPNQVINKDYKEKSLFQKQPAVDLLEETAKFDKRKQRPTNLISQNLDKDKELNIATPLCSIPSKIDINYENVTMDKLFEEFCSGRISLEDFYQMSTNIPGEVKEETLYKLDKKESIQALEQQVLEAAQSINESQYLVEKVKCLIQEPEATEADRRTTQNCKSEEKLLSNLSQRQQNDLILDNILKENVGWQEALSSYRNQGKTDTLLQFLDAVDFENITSDMIDEIIQYENSTWPNEAWKTPELKVSDDSTFLGHERIRSTTLSSNKMLPRIRSDEMSKHKGLNHQEFMQNEVDADATGSDLVITEDRMKVLPSGSESPKLHLNLKYIRSPDSSHLSSSGSLLGDSTSLLDHEEKLQQRRREIREWIKKQRQKRREQAKSDQSLTFTKPQPTSNKTLVTSRGHARVPDEAVSNVTAENIGLTGKQLQERSQDRGVKRGKQRENHQKKREADIAKLLDDHKEEVTMYHSHVKPKFAYESPSILIKNKKLQNVKSSLNKSSHLGTKTYGNFHSRSVHASVSQKKPGLSRYFKNSTEEWRRRQQRSLVGSFPSDDFSGETEKHCVEERHTENSTSLQMELYYLKRCLMNKDKDKHKTGLGSKDKQETSLDQSYYYTLLSKEKNKIEKISPKHLNHMVNRESEVSSSMTREPSSWRSLPMSSTYTLPLDRISEVASNISETSLSESHQEVEEPTPFVPAGEDTSTDSSWTVPEEVKHLLYSSQ